MRFVFLFLLFASVLSARPPDPSWMTDPAAAREKAAKENRHLLILFSGTGWCWKCDELTQKVLKQETFRKLASERLILCYIETPRVRPASVTSLLRELGAGECPGLPHTFLLTPEGRLLGHIAGYRSAPGYLLQLRRLLAPLPPTIKAVRFGTMDDLKKALKKTPVDARDVWDNTALHEAVRKGDPAMVSYLLARGADPNAVTTGGIVPCHTLFMRRFPDPVREKLFDLLLKAGADLNFSDPRSCRGTPFLVMLMSGAPVPIVEKALNAGADPNRADDNGVFPLNAVLFFRNATPEHLRLLVKYGADPRKTDPVRGITALHAAVMNQASPEVIRTLLELGVPPEVRDKKGHTAVEYSRDPEIRAILSGWKQPTSSSGTASGSASR